MMNVGHTYVGVSDMDTIGSPLKYSLCCAENEAESPWEPYHVTRGHPREATTVTVHFVYGICELYDFQSTAPERLVEVFARAGWGRAEIQAALYREARLPFRRLMLNKEPKALLTAHPELGWLRDHPDLPLPVVEDPGCFEIAVVGGAAGRGAYFFGAGEPVTMPVED